MKPIFVLVAPALAALLTACVVPDAKRIAFERAPAGDDVAAIVRARTASSQAAGRTLVVYEGATWCEPCQRFHDAAAAGKLDAEFGDLDFLEFDRDADDGRLRAAGYTSTYIPLFVVPQPDGRGSQRRMEGGVKGDGAVVEISARLRGLLQR